MDVVSLVISSGFSAASLAVAIAGWRDTQAQRPSVTVERPDGVTVTISGRSAEEAQQLVRQLVAEHDNA